MNWEQKFERLERLPDEHPALMTLVVVGLASGMVLFVIANLLN